MIKITTHEPDAAMIIAVVVSPLLSKASVTSMVSLPVVTFGDIAVGNISENYRII